MTDFMRKETTAVLLAAGLGTRLGALTQSVPKPLLGVGGRSLLGHAIRWLKYLGVARIVVVGGYMYETMEAQAKAEDSAVVVVRNPDYATSQRMVSLLKAADEIRGDLMVQDADYFYHRAVADRLRGMDYPEMAVHATREVSPYSAQDVIATTDADGKLLGLVKTVGTQPIKEKEHYFNSLLVCPEAKIRQFFQLAEDMVKEIGPKIHVEDAVLQYSRRHTVKVRDLGTPLWVEVDTPQELAAAEKFLADYPDAVCP